MVLHLLRNIVVILDLSVK